MLLLSITLLTACGDRLFYHPDKVLYRTPDQDGYDFEPFKFQSADGTILRGWLIASQGPSKGLVIHYHGNAQNMSAHYSYVSWLPQRGFDLLQFDYRGYGASEGVPSRKGVYEDSVAVLNYTLSQDNLKNKPIFVLGQSLGGAMAITALGKNQFKSINGVIIDSAFRSHQAIASDALRSSPMGSILSSATPALVSDGLDPEDWVDQISPIPIVFIHGSEDKVIPIAHSEALYELAKEPKEFWIVDNGRHTDALATHKEKYISRLLDFFEKYSPRN